MTVDARTTAMKKTLAEARTTKCDRIIWWIGDENRTNIMDGTGKILWKGFCFPDAHKIAVDDASPDGTVFCLSQDGTALRREQLPGSCGN